MMSFVIKYLEVAGHLTMNKYPPPAGSMVRMYDPDANDGLGDVLFTLNPKLALKFDTQTEAYEFWMQTSKVRPLRNDGLPNRPLTAFSVEIAPI